MTNPLIQVRPAMIERPANRPKQQLPVTQRAARVAALLSALLALAACGAQGSGRLPSNQTLEQNAPSNRDYTPANSLPPGF